MRLKLIAIFTLLFTIGSCRKDLVPPDADGTPEFGVTANMNGIPMKLEAGVDDYFLYTYADTSLGEVWQAVGTLQKRDCINCNSYFTLRFRNDHAGYSNGMSTTFLSSGDIALADWSGVYEDSKSVVRFFADPNNQNGTVVSHFWNFGDGNTSTDPSPTHTFNMVGGNSVFSVMHITTLNGGCSGAQTNTVNAKSECPLDFEVYVVGQTVYFSPLTLASGSYVYQWQFGDMQSSYISNPAHVFTAPGEYNVLLTVENTTLGCSSSISKKVIVGQTGCHANFSYVVDEIIVPTIDLEQFGTVEIEYVNETGRRYMSSIMPQSAQCKLTKVEPYKPNHEGKATLKVTLETDCTLVSENFADTIHMQNAVFNFAIGLP
jgi:PKD repeat protein